MIYYIIALIACIVGLLAFFAIKGEIKTIEEILFKLVTEAEKQYGSGTGALKKAAVIEWIYGKLPPLLRGLISAERLSDMVEQALEAAKKKWLENSNLKNYIEEGRYV